jgi:serine/threonine protein kinase
VSELSNSSGMSGNQWQQIRDIFDEAASLHLEERKDFLQRRCNGDDALRAEVQSLLEATDSEEIVTLKFLADGSISQSENRVIGPYRLDKLLGRGGMGAVYLSHRADGEFHKQVAIKLIDLPHASDLYRDQFRIERQILARLNHPYIARLLDGGISDQGELYLVMEYVDGIPILRYCKEAKLSLRSRLLLFRKLCAAVQYAHQNLVIHRDLKPDNILVISDGTPHLVDFGTAKMLSTSPEDSGSQLTLHGMRAFTPQFASPEQVLGKPMSTASDTYSLGVLLFHLAADVPPYELNEFSTGEMLRVICSKEPPRPSSVAISPEPPDEDLDSIILKAMRKEPEERYLTVAQLDADIEAWLEGRPVIARRGTLRYRVSKFARRNKFVLGAAFALLAAITCGAAGIFWQWRVAVHERDTEEVTAQEMRELSSSFLSEIDAAVRDLPGSTPVRQLMVICRQYSGGAARG